MEHRKSKFDAISESTITSKVQDQNTIEAAHSSLVKTILQAAERKISRDEERLPVAWWNKECKREERI